MEVYFENEKVKHINYQNELIQRAYVGNSHVYFYPTTTTARIPYLSEGMILFRRSSWYDYLKHVVGIDRGLRFLSTAYDEQGNTSFVSGKNVIAKRRKYKRLRQQLQSKSTKSAKRRLKAINQRENRWMSDINHQVTKTLVDKYGSGTVFTIEDLTNVRFATEKVSKQHRYEQVSWAFYQFEQFLTYKAELQGSIVVKIDAHYTSQRCPKCGSIDKSARNHGTHEYHCTHCEYTSNDDRIGAMNIQLLGTNWVTDKSTSFKQVKSNEE